MAIHHTQESISIRFEEKNITSVKAASDDAETATETNGVLHILSPSAK